ncbi:MAG: inorganic diphosphatase [Verrucomicrobiota bacterium]
MENAEKANYLRHRPHPWHGISAMVEPPAIVNAFIEVTRFDTIKFEVDPHTGYLSVDRPQRNSSLPPNPYGFVPQTLCAQRVADMLPGCRDGDGDALDICVLCEQEINRSEVILAARVVGGFNTTDSGKSDPKLIAILEGDLLWGDIEDLDAVPQRQLDRLEHYFRQYKVEKKQENPVEIVGRIHRDNALELLQAARDDYDEVYGEKS